MSSNTRPNLISDALAIELRTNTDCLPEQVRARERERIRRDEHFKSPAADYLLEKSHVAAPVMAVLAIASFVAFRNPVFTGFIAFFALGAFCNARNLRRVSAIRTAFQERLESWVTTNGSDELRQKLSANRLRLKDILDAAAEENFRAVDGRFRRYEGEVNPVQFRYGVPPSTDEEIMMDAIREFMPQATFHIARVRPRYESELGNTVVLGVRETTEIFGALERWYYT